MAARKTQGSGRERKGKLFHKIKDVCELTSTEPYVLRYWEQEFPFLAPEKNKAGHRIYSDDDIELVRRIKKLLYDEGYTTAGARRQLEKERAGEAAAPAEAQTASSGSEAVDAEELEALRTENAELKERLGGLEEDRKRLVDSLKSLRSDAEALRELVRGPGDGGPAAAKKGPARKKAPAKKKAASKPARKRKTSSSRKKTGRKR